MTVREIDKDQPASKGCWKGAFVRNWREYGYHFLRQDPEGTWSYKDGPEPVQKADNNGNFILNPSQAPIQPYQVMKYYEIGPKKK